MSDLNESRTQTYSGLYYDFLNPSADMIRLEDVAHQLSQTCRFSGATRKFYSVAEHSVLVSRLVVGNKAEALMHDAHETYLWDIPRPAKPLYGEVYKTLGDAADQVIAEKFGLDVNGFTAPNVKYADNLMLNYEGNNLMVHWSEPEPLIPEGVLDWTLGLNPEPAEKLFLQEAVRLGLSQKVDFAPPLPQVAHGNFVMTSDCRVNEQLTMVPTTKGAGNGYETM